MAHTNLQREESNQHITVTIKWRCDDEANFHPDQDWNNFSPIIAVSINFHVFGSRAVMLLYSRQKSLALSSFVDEMLETFPGNQCEFFRNFLHKGHQIIIITIDRTIIC